MCIGHSIEIFIVYETAYCILLQFPSIIEWASMIVKSSGSLALDIAWFW